MQFVAVGGRHSSAAHAGQANNAQRPQAVIWRYVKTGRHMPSSKLPLSVEGSGTLSSNVVPWTHMSIQYTPQIAYRSIQPMLCLTSK